MNFKRITLVLLFSLLTVSQFSFASQGKKQSGKVDLDLVFIGNSITYGAFFKNPEKDAPPVTAAEILRKKKGINSVSFSNQGRSGLTTVDCLPSNGVFPQVVEAAAEIHNNPLHLLVFSIKLGTNDSAVKGTNGAPVSKEDYKKNMKVIIDALLVKFPHAKVVIQQPIWYSPNTQNGATYLAEGLARLQLYFPEINSLVAGYSATHKNQVFMGDTKAFGYFEKNHLTDLVPEEGKQGTFYLHPNKKGAAKLAEFWAEAIYKIIKIS